MENIDEDQRLIDLSTSNMITIATSRNIRKKKIIMMAITCFKSK